MSPTQHKIGSAIVIAETRPLETRADTPDMFGCALSIIIIGLWIFCAATSADIHARDRI